MRFFKLFVVLCFLAVSANAQIRVTTSSASYTDSQGNVWSPDKPYASAGNLDTITHAIGGPVLPATTDQALYQSERWGNFTHTFPVANGNYNITFKFSENAFGAANARVFSVMVNGVAVLSNFDIFSAAGGEWTAIDKTFPVSVTTGSIVVAYPATVNFGKVDSIAIIPAPPSVPPTVPTPPSSGTIFVTLGVGAAWGSATPPPASKSVVLTWAASASPGIASYTVYRSSTSGTGYQKVATGITGLTWTDTSVLGSSTYYYVVTAVAPPCPANVTSTTPPCGESAYSNQASVSIP